jgi:opacity protein-like surface antigen
MRATALFASAAISAALIAGMPPALAGDFLGGTAQRWSGLYVGGYLGRHSIKTDGIFDGVELGVQPLLDRIGDKGVHGGAHAGFAMQWGFAVFGIEADYGKGGFKGSFETVQDGSATEAGLPSYPISGDLDFLASVRARAGIALAGPFGTDLLFFVSGGRAFTDFTMDIADGRSKVGFRDQGTAFGAGAEVAVTGRLSLRAEYLRFDFGKRLEIDDVITSGIFDANAGNFVQLNDVRLLRVGASYKLLP